MDPVHEQLPRKWCSSTAGYLQYFSHLHQIEAETFYYGKENLHLHLQSCTEQTMFKLYELKIYSNNIQLAGIIIYLNVLDKDINMRTTVILQLAHM